MTKQLETLLEELKPEIKADKVFKQKLHTRIEGIIEFKRWNQVVKKISYLKVLFPIFACMALVVWVFSMTNIQLFQSGENNDFSTPNMIPEDPIAPTNNTLVATQNEPIEEIATKTVQEGKDKTEAPLSIKEKILAKAAQKKATESESTPNPESYTSNIQEENIPQPNQKTDVDINSEEDRDTNETAPSSIGWSNQDMSADDMMPDFTESMILWDDESNDSEEIQETVQDGEIAEEIFKNTCEAAGWSIVYQSGSTLCNKEEKTICTRLDYENNKCENLE